MKLYILEGAYDSELEGMIFAVCTTEDKAKKAKELSIYDNDDLDITEVIADTVCINNEIITID